MTGEEVREDLSAVSSGKHPTPQFEGQTEPKLRNSEGEKVTNRFRSDARGRILLENPQIAKKIVDSGILASKARSAAKRAREVTRPKSGLEFSNLTGKLADCSSTDARHSELFSVAGNSAGGSAKVGRNSGSQAVLQVPGKIFNVEKASIDKKLAKDVVRSFRTAMGIGFCAAFDVVKAR